MNEHQWDERLEEQTVTYMLEINGQLIVVENVPARVNMETGEQLFSPQTVERLQSVVQERRKPVRMMQVPVYEYA
jgi:YgiT-type zinc finger domain-containing protein